MADNVRSQKSSCNAACLSVGCQFPKSCTVGILPKPFTYGGLYALQRDGKWLLNGQWVPEFSLQCVIPQSEDNLRTVAERLRATLYEVQLGAEPLARFEL